jgi:cytochrome P450
MTMTQPHVDDRWFDPDVLENPFDYLSTLRRDEPIYFSEALGAYVTTRYDDVAEVLRSPEVFASQLSGMGEAQANFSTAYAHIYEAAGVPPLLPTLQASDGAVHRRYRQMVDSTFTAATVRGLDDDIRRRVEALVDEFIEAERVDLYAEFCMKLPLHVICDLSGVPHELTSILRKSAAAMVRLVVPTNETPESLEQLHRDQAEFQRAILGVIREFRAHPDDTKLLSRLLTNPAKDGSHLTDQEVMALMTVLNVGGNETTTNGLGNMFHLCFSAEGREAELRADRARIERFVEEALRIESPVSCLPRRVTRDTELGGIRIAEGSIVMVSFASANRDEAEFKCPHAVDFDRENLKRHTAFGAGPHFCLGAALSRLEMNSSLNVILDRMENIRLDPNAPPPRHDPKLAVRAFDSLPIIFSKRPA